MADDLYDDLYEYLHTAELRASFERFLYEWWDQASRCRQEGGQLWGPDKSQWRVKELAMQRALDKERQRGTPEDVLEEMPGALERWVQRGIEKYGHGQARKKSDLT